MIRAFEKFQSLFCYDLPGCLYQQNRFYHTEKRKLSFKMTQSLLPRIELKEESKKEDIIHQVPGVQF
jgi:hypothetical protein